MEQGKEFTYDEESIFGEFDTFFLGGVDTTSSYLASILSLIAFYPEVQRKVREEIQEHMKEDDFSFSNLKKLVYLEGVQKKTTRMYGPGTLDNFSRLCMKDHELKGIPIKKGVLLHNTSMGLHMS